MISQKTRSTLKIAIGTIIITIGTFLLVMFASGFTFDILQGKILATGLVLLDSNPNGASIVIDRKKLTQKTPHRLEGVETGEINIGYTHSEYRDWKSNYFVRAGEVTFADYALLIPNKINPKLITSNVNFIDIVHSEDKSKQALISASPVSIWEQTSNDQLNKIFSPPLINGRQPVQIKESKFSQDASQILCTIVLDDGSTVQGLVGFPSGQFINLGEMFHIPLGQLEFNPQNARELYSLNTSIIRRLNTENRSSTELPISNVSSFTLYDDRMYTLENNPVPSPSQVLISYDLAGNGRYVLAEFAKSDQAGALMASKYNGINYISVFYPEQKKLTLVRKEADRVQISELGTNIGTQSFSPKGRFFVFVKSNKLLTIDLEFMEHFHSSTNAENVKNIQWLTDYQLIFGGKSELHIMDFNGQNDYLIPPNSSAESIIYSSIRENKKISFINSGQLFSYSLQPKTGLINFR